VVKDCATGIRNYIQKKKIKSESKFIDSITDYLTVLFKTEGAEERDKWKQTILGGFEQWTWSCCLGFVHLVRMGHNYFPSYSLC